MGDYEWCNRPGSARGENGEEIIDSEDMYYLGNAVPTYVGGINNSFMFKNLTFSFYFGYALGHSIINGMKTHMVKNAMGDCNSILGNIVYDCWSGEGDTDAKYARYTPNDSDWGNTCVICMIGATVSFFCFRKTSADAPWILNAFFIVLSSFFIYGPQALLGVSASQYATKKASASANGFIGIFCYAATLISGIGFGYLADQPELGWSAVFTVALIFGVVGTVILMLMWKAPADGYKKADKVLTAIENSNC